MWWDDSYRAAAHEQHEEFKALMRRLKESNHLLSAFEEADLAQACRALMAHYPAEGLETLSILAYGSNLFCYPHHVRDFLKCLLAIVPGGVAELQGSEAVRTVTSTETQPVTIEGLRAAVEAVKEEQVYGQPPWLTFDELKARGSPGPTLSLPPRNFHREMNGEWLTDTPAPIRTEPSHYVKIWSGSYTIRETNLQLLDMTHFLRTSVGYETTPLAPIKKREWHYPRRKLRKCQLRSIARRRQAARKARRHVCF